MNEKQLLFLITILFGMIIVLICIMLHTIIYRMARIYNWNGKRYCYLGYVPIYREEGGFAVRFSEHMVDLSRTTLYRICLGRTFCNKNRYRHLFVYAEGNRQHVVVDRGEMKTEIPF